VNREIDDLGDRLCEDVGALGVDRSELFDEPASDSEHESADTGGS
jgi:hypothetical protein